MLKKIICSGVGGQGVLTLGMLLAEAAAAQGKFVTWVPEYGSEMRGGSACCKVKIGDEAIISPFMEEMDILVALHQKSLDQYARMVEEGGTILVESVLVEQIPEITVRKVVKVPATDIAGQLNNPKGMSVAMAGAIVASTKLFPLEAATREVESYFEKKHLPVESNRELFLTGYEYVKEHL